MQVPHTLSGEGFAVGAEGRLNSRDSEVEVEPENNLYPPPGCTGSVKTDTGRLRILVNRLDSGTPPPEST